MRQRVHADRQTSNISPRSLSPPISPAPGYVDNKNDLNVGSVLTVGGLPAQKENEPTTRAQKLSQKPTKSNKNNLMIIIYPFSIVGINI